MDAFFVFQHLFHALRKALLVFFIDPLAPLLQKVVDHIALKAKGLAHVVGNVEDIFLHVSHEYVIRLFKGCQRIQQKFQVKAAIL